MPLASSPMPSRRPDARPPALMAMMPPASSPLIAMMPRADPAPIAMMPMCVEQADGDDADRDQRTQRKRADRDHVREREAPLPDAAHVHHAEHAEQREDDGGEHGERCQDPGYPLKDLSNVLFVLKQRRRLLRVRSLLTHPWFINRGPPRSGRGGRAVG